MISHSVNRLLSRPLPWVWIHLRGLSPWPWD